ncbi:MAG: DUF4249 domain-containing protein [Saprospiraceae bacterium]|nr:DUF4249 domain-containing protein [Saprospiraceae bacterium]
MNKLAIFLAASTLLLSSCEKVIELDLNNSDPQIVVEAWLSDDPSERAQVWLSQSVNFDQSNTYPPLSNATVFIKNRTTGEVDTLKEVGNSGIYGGSKLVAQVGQTYDLTVNVKGKTLTSSATVPRKVNLDSIRLTRTTFFGNENLQIVPRYLDPKGIGDNYRFVLSVNGNKKTDLLIQNDALSDGAYNARPLFGRMGDNDIKIGDTLSLEMRCIDAGSYFYFDTLSEGGGGPNSSSATPTNPVSNIKGGALGYFSVYTKQVKSTIVK